MTSTVKLKPEVKAKLLEALRSGRYKQGKGYLRNVDNCFCVLGVLCDVVEPDSWVAEGSLFHHDGRHICPSFTLVKSVLTDEDSNAAIAFMTLLYEMNDEGVTFPDLADYVEAVF